MKNSDEYFLEERFLYLIENHRLVMEKRFAHPSDPKSYAGGSLCSW
jgi:hypothetical protein